MTTTTIGPLELAWLLASWAAMLGVAGNFVVVRMRRGPRPAGSGVQRPRGLDLAITGWRARLRLRRRLVGETSRVSSSWDEWRSRA